MDEAIAVAKEEAQEEERSKNRKEILGLIRKGYTSADIEKYLRKQTRSTTA